MSEKAVQYFNKNVKETLGLLGSNLENGLTDV